MLVLVASLAPAPLRAHHNKGLPHYGYFENYPQVPTEEYVVIQGRWEMGASIFNFQGLQRRDADTPNDVKIFLYLYDLESDMNYKDQVAFEIRKGEEVVATYLRPHIDEEAVYSTRETLPSSGYYEIVAHIGGIGGQQVSLPFYADLAQDRVNWLLLVGIGLPVVIVFGLALFGHQRSRRIQPKLKRSPVGAPVLVLQFLEEDFSLVDWPCFLAAPFSHYSLFLKGVPQTVNSRYALQVRASTIPCFVTAAFVAVCVVLFAKTGVFASLALKRGSMGALRLSLMSGNVPVRFVCAVLKFALQML